jgi:hypothetical protein
MRAALNSCGSPVTFDMVLSRVGHSVLKKINRECGGESMKYYVQYKRSAEPFYRTYGSLNSAREVMDVLRTGRQLDSNLHYIWARYQSPPERQASLPTTLRSLGPEIR